MMLNKEGADGLGLLLRFTMVWDVYEGPDCFVLFLRVMMAFEV